MKILLIHVPAGAGHQRAAEAIFEAFRLKGSTASIQIVNALEYTDPGYQWSFSEGYLNVVRHFTPIWAIGYHLTNWRAMAPFFQRLHRRMNRLHAEALAQFILQERPDQVVGTHFLPMEVAGFVKLRWDLPTRLTTVITDFRAHTLWVSKGIDAYVVGSSQAAQDLKRLGVEEQTILSTGIPIDPSFARHQDPADLRRRLGLHPSHFTILLGSGGAGVGPVLTLLDELERVPAPLQILAVAGTNVPLYDQLVERAQKGKHRIQPYPFVKNMDELMEVSDLMITKPGGLTCAEATAEGLPLILVSPIPGQEARNAQVLCEEGAAFLARNPRQVLSEVLDLMNHQEIGRAHV